jgi:type II secretory pathway pseudopilin PulG
MKLPDQPLFLGSKSPHIFSTVQLPERSLIGRRMGAFSLVELLTVMAVISLLVGLGTQLAGGVFGSGKFNANVAKASAILDQARQYAIANNTYVWVAFRQNPPMATRPLESVAIAVIASQDGTNPVGWNGTVDVPGSTLQLVNKIEWMEGTQLGLSSSVSAILNPPSRPTQSGENLASDLRFRIPVAGTMVEFDQVTAFTPRGEALVGEGLVAYADIPLEPFPAAADNRNVAIIQLSGITGIQRVYRQ